MAQDHWWTRLVDDAAIFPPGEAPLSDAVTAYAARRGEPWSDLVGPLVLSDRLLPGLPDLIDGDAQPGLALSVVCSGGAGSLEPAAHWARQTPGVELAALELALRDLDDLPGSARRVSLAADAVASAGIESPVHVEVPALPPDGRADPGWLAALDELAAADLRLKFRTGDPTGTRAPSAAALAAQIEAALDRELAFKCTAGLHRAVRAVDPGTGEASHGFLNVLLATRASLDGEDVAPVLETTDPETMLARLHHVGDDALVRTRRWFTSFGCCGVEDPYDDLVRLGVLE